MILILSTPYQNRRNEDPLPNSSLPGYGPGVESLPFETLPPGVPGSPSQVTASDLSSTSAVVCWMESVIGIPYTAYFLEITEVDSSSDVRVRRFNTSAVGAIPSSDNCNTGIKVCNILVFFMVMTLYLPHSRSLASHQALVTVSECTMLTARRRGAPAPPPQNTAPKPPPALKETQLVVELWERKV